MLKRITTLTDFILHEERAMKFSSGSFTMLITQIENAIKIIASHVQACGLVDILGKTGKTNSYGEEVQKLDIFANTLLVSTLINSGQVYAVISEEMSRPVFAPDGKGKYIVYIDPLDGSSNIDTNSPIGTIFSIYRKNSNLLQKGDHQVAAGYAIYGSSVMLVYTVGNGVNGFTLDPTIGSFLLSHPGIRVPEAGRIYSINDAYENKYDKNILHFLHAHRESGDYKARYSGSMIADVHRIFLKGGIFLYPANREQQNGKLRLMMEVNPFAFLTEQARGMAVSYGNKSPLSVRPSDICQRAPLILGSRYEVNTYIQSLKARR